MTALVGLDDHALWLGAERVIHKPFTMRELNRLVDEPVRAINASERE